MSSNQIPKSPALLSSPTEIVHLEYDLQSLAPLADPQQWTRFVCVSDTHSRAFDVPLGDVLVHSGDLTNLGTVVEFKKTMDWLYSLPHKLKMYAAIFWCSSQQA